MSDRSKDQLKSSQPSAHIGRGWLGVYFHCCRVYGRIYKSTDGARYEGQCPRCGGRVRATVGPGGTTRRMFEAG